MKETLGISNFNIIIYSFKHSSKRIKLRLIAVLPLFGNYKTETYGSEMEVLKLIAAEDLFYTELDILNFHEVCNTHKEMSEIYNRYMHITDPRMS